MAATVSGKSPWESGQDSGSGHGQQDLRIGSTQPKGHRNSLNIELAYINVGIHKMSLALPTSYPSPTSLSCQKCSVFFPSTSLSSSSILIPSLAYKFFIYSWAPPRRSIVEWVGAPDSCARAGLRGTLGPKRGQGRSWRAGSTGPGRPLPMCHPKCHLWKIGLCRSSRAEPVAVISSAEPQNMPGLGWGPYDNTIV